MDDGSMWSTVTGLFFLLISAIRYACLLGLFSWLVNILFGLQIGDLPPIWQVGVSLTIGLVVTDILLRLRTWYDNRKQRQGRIRG